MTSANDITNKIINAYINKKDVVEIVTNYMQELLIDLGNRYAFSDITHHIVAAALKMHTDLIYSCLDEEGKAQCDNLIANTETAVKEIKIPMVYKQGGGKE